MKRTHRLEKNGVIQDSSDVDETVDVAMDDAVTNGDHIHQVQPIAKKVKLNKGELYKPPTNEEITQLKETESLFQSGLFRMQINELLGEVRLKKTKKSQLDSFLHTLKESIMAVKNMKTSFELKNQDWLKKLKIKVPIKQEPLDVKGKFQFQKPKSVKVIGSYLLGTCTKPDYHVDLALEIPKECIQAKDHLNHRYLRKRALYLTCIAAHLRKDKSIEKLEFSYHHGNPMKPIVIVTPTGSVGKTCTVHLHTTIEEDCFKLNRFHINKNNVRSGWLFGETEEKEENDESPTPQYNTAILADMLLEKNLQFLHSTIGGSQNIQDGVTLLKIWLGQRELNKGQGSFSGFILSMYVAHLVSLHKVSPLMSSYQIVRTTLLNLSTFDWLKDGIMMHGTSEDPLKPTREEFKAVSGVVFVDPSGYLNICADMTPDTLKRVQHEAKLSLQHMEETTIDAFEILFMQRVPFTRTFDTLIHIKTSCAIEHAVKQHRNSDVRSASAVVPSILQVVTRALGNRASLVCHKLQPCEKWDIKDGDHPDENQLCLGVLLNEEHSNSLLEKGPPADSPEAKGFRNFWGEKSELRRFKDGSICEAVVWNAETIAAKRHVTSKIIKHVLTRHFNITESCIKYMGNHLDSLLCIPHRSNKNKPRPDPSYGTGEEHSFMVMKTYETLSKIIRNLDDLPLTVNTIQGSDAVFRHTQVFPQEAASYKPSGIFEGKRRLPSAGRNVPPVLAPLKVICIMEGSGKMPEDKDAMQRIKAAFHIKLAELLHKQHNLETVVHTDHVDIFKDGFLFAVYLSFLREIAVLKLETAPNGMVKMKDNSASVALEKDIVHTPKLTSTLNGLGTEHQTYCAVARLAKRWISAQYLGDYIQDEVVDMIVAYLYISPAPHTAPVSVLGGFSRFLYLVSTYDWNLNPLIINFNNVLTKEEITSIQVQFSKDRTSFPLMCLPTSFDQSGGVWSRRSPNPMMLNRLVVLAKESLLVLENHLTHCTKGVDLKQIFRAPLDHYDVIIKLIPKYVPTAFQSVDVPDETIIPKFGEYSNDHVLPVIDFNPVQLFLKELRESFDDIALFFYDKYGGDVIAVLWKPPSLQPSKFQVSHIDARRVDVESNKQDVQMVTNIEAIIQDFYTIGQGLVKSVTKTQK
ncbi:unnamed protein product [Owenia fusiformis]|uniref:Nucleolar protein 6 n=1 Tax=Owenia fusiformis TaxID=6347 RepID=A0A8S4PTU9_OWEFU|nr:unnamed protein product [Owenia fusiformis]